jgi:Ca2+-transporting ATPase
LAFADAISRGILDSEARAVAFVSLVTCDFLLVFVNRTFSSSIIASMRRPNLALWVVLAVTAVLLATSLAVPLVCSPFAFAPMTAADFLRVLVVRHSHDRAPRINKIAVAFEWASVA